ncbi:MAG TPA: SDR family oxidoreductase [Jatrophihabitans sp.]|nr:SDR family oxidoreductase [Jatrophihabitans sp.]
MSLLVTGSDSGIGRAVVELAERRGHQVHALDLATGVDAADDQAVAEFVAGIDDLSAVAHIAGVVSAGSVDDVGMAEWDRVIRNNLTSAFVIARHTVPRLAAAGGGAMVLMSSLNARDGGNRLSGVAYASAKAGVLGLMRHLAVVWGARNVRVNAVAPGPVATPIHDRLTAEQRALLLDKMPLRRISAADEIAEIILFLLSEACASVTGTTFDVNEGMYPT